MCRGFRALRRAPGRGGGGRAAGDRGAAPPGGLPVRGPAGDAVHPGRGAVPGLHAVREGVAPTRLGRSGGATGPGPSGSTGCHRPPGPQHRRPRRPFPSRARPRRWLASMRSSMDLCMRTPNIETVPPSTAHHACRPISSGAACTRGRRWPACARVEVRATPMASARLPPSWPGGTSMPTCCSIAPTRWDTASTRRWRRWRSTTGRGPTIDSLPGARVGRAFRSWTPACASSLPKAGCTTGCG